jgi:ElaB/YqjD/DUF883 family membrane-anchored ribosome-binding protein
MKKSDVEELKRMQSETAKTRAERKRNGSTEASGPEEKPEMGKDQNSTETPAAQDPVGEDQVLEPEQNAQHFADQLAEAVKQIEDATREHPVLALLAAFTTGIVTGNLLSRR